MAYDEEKEKSHENLWGLQSFYFIWVLGATNYQGVCIEWVGEVQIVKNFLQNKFPKKIGHIRVSDRIPEALAEHVRASPYPRVNLA
jgi:hypothetical protein